MERIYRPYKELEGPPVSDNLRLLRDRTREIYPNQPSVYMAGDRVHGTSWDQAEKSEVLRAGNQYALRLYNLALKADPSLDFFGGPNNWHFFHSQVGDGDLTVARKFEVWHADQNEDLFGTGLDFLLHVPASTLAGLELIRSRARQKLLCSDRLRTPKEIEELMAEDPDLESFSPQGNRLLILPNSCYHRRREIDYLGLQATPAQALQDFGFRVDLA